MNWRHQQHRRKVANAYKMQVHLLDNHQFSSGVQNSKESVTFSVEMMFKIILLVACVIAVQAGVLPSSEKSDETYNSHPSYTFSYDVQDSNTGDFKSQTETRDGDNLQGQYMLHDPDGYKRIVMYSHDAINGFQANVRREPLDAAYLVRSESSQPLKMQELQPQFKSYVQQPTAVLRSYSAPAIVQAPASALIHSQPAVHLSPALIKSAPALIAQQPTYAGQRVSFVY